MPLTHVVQPGQNVHLADIDPSDTYGISHHDAHTLSERLEDQLRRRAEQP